MSIGGLSPELDYWREDMLANEHHQHWHEVYPFTGRPPLSFDQVAAELSDAETIALLEAIRPGVDWAATVPGASAAQIARFFAEALDTQGRQRLLASFFGVAGSPSLPRALLRKVLVLNDRHGELFLYMHRQMLARYDAELLSHGKDRVQPFSPSTWSNPISEGYDPEGLSAGQLPFTIRRANQTLADQWVDRLRDLQAQVDQVLRTGVVPSIDGSEPARAVDASSLGEFVEEQLHNTGHGLISRLSEPLPPGRPGAGQPNGVMNNPMAAIRDQVFWRWHKQIDDLGAKWQDTLDAVDFGDGPFALIRDGFGVSPVAWKSPDIILVLTSDLPTGRTAMQLLQLGEGLFGGNRWDTDFTSVSVQSGGTSLDTTSELVTFVDTSNLPDGRIVKFLNHEPFTYFLRLENTSDHPIDITARIFLVPSNLATDRRAWIEMDKFTATVAAGARAVIHRSDVDSSVIKRPAETSPAVRDSGPSNQLQSYCDCGWPYTLLLPRGKPAPGMTFRLLVMLTDADVDRVVEQGHCGSMSFCGARDRYPDTREMGYPFARPFSGRRSSAIRDFILARPNAAARTLTIRHAGV